MKIFKNLTAILAAAVLVTGCATVETESWQNCALAGAAVGAAGGAFANDTHEGENAAMGAAVGALIGGTICALTAEEEAVVSQETDTDADGVVDSLDECPNTPVGAKVDSKGCPLADTDGDGVPDYKDECPNSAPGAVVNEIGCADALVLNGVNFKFNSDELTEASKDVLRPIAEMHHMYHGNVDLAINGYTSSEGAEAYNQALSQRRAESVRAFMVEVGCAAERLTAVGYGEANPVADNGTEAGRVKNRRVEIDLK